MTKPLVAISHWVHPETIAYLEQQCDVLPNPSKETPSQDALLDQCRDAHALKAFMPDQIDEKFLKACPKLQVIAGAFKGYDNIDVEACTSQEVWFTIVPDLLIDPTADLTLGLLLNLARRLHEGNQLIREEAFTGWRPELYSRGLSGRSVGLVGMGKLGRAVARRLKGFEVDLRYTDPIGLPENEEWALGAVRMNLEELLKESDYVIVLVPLTPSSLHLIDSDTIKQMKPGAILINTGRGSVVDEKAVAEALRTGHLGGYAADVFETEDLSRKDRPSSIPSELLDDTSKTFFTPHLGSAVEQVRQQIERYAARSILQALNGEIPDGAVNQIDAKRTHFHLSTAI